MSDRRLPLPEDHTPIVLVRRVGRSLIIDRCPHCAGRHIHGDAGERGRQHGHRLAHCRGQHGDSPGYKLVEAAPA